MVAIKPLGPHGRLLSDNFGRRTSQIKVDLSTSTYVNVRLFTMFVNPGDTLILHGEVNLTNNTGRDLEPPHAVTGVRYPVGAAPSLWIYNANAPAELRPATWLRLGTGGENATVDGHHLYMSIERDYTVPADWDPNEQMGIVLRVDAHSTGHDDNDVPDYLLVETHGYLSAQHWLASGTFDPPAGS